MVYKKQWRWRCTFRDCLDVCKEVMALGCIVKLHEDRKSNRSLRTKHLQDLDDNVVIQMV